MYMSLKTKLIGGFLIVALFATLIGLIGYRGMVQAKTAQDEVSVVRLPSINGLWMMTKAIADLVRVERTLVTQNLGKEELDLQLKDSKACLESYEKGFKIYEPLPQTKEEEGVWKEYLPAADAWKKEHEKILSLVEQGKRDEAFAQVYGPAKETYHRVDTLIDKLLDINIKVADDAANDFRSTFKTTNLLSISSVVIGIAASLALGIFLSLSICRSLTRVSDSLSEGSEQVTSASTQLSATAQGMAEGSSEQAASLEETSSAMEEMSAMTRQNAENAGQAKSLAGQAGSSVDKANASMQQMVKKMGEISSKGEETGKIIKTIDEIAFQTNLLALNAAVEAARAGEAGAGFAVVADEVRNLAQRAAASAKTTSELIEGTIKNINEGMSLVESTNSDFQDVAQAVRKVNELVGEISAASSEQARGITEVSSAISQMDKVTQSNAAGAEEIASSSEELSSQAISLTEIVRTLQEIILGEYTGERGGPSHPVATKPRSPVASPRRLSAPGKGSGSVGQISIGKSPIRKAKAEETIPLNDMGEF
jgi:methyl-accepting chemotaxis protein